jgi:hypothetical protein
VSVRTLPRAIHAPINLTSAPIEISVDAIATAIEPLAANRRLVVECAPGILCPDCSGQHSQHRADCQYSLVHRNLLVSV